MTKILITEFINENSLNKLKKNFEVHYDEKLWNQTEKLIKTIKDFDALISKGSQIILLKE